VALGSSTHVSSVAADVDGDSLIEVVTGGYFYY
jgi:hypothetical protein